MNEHALAASITGAFERAARLVPLKKRYVEATLIRYIGALTTGAHEFVDVGGDGLVDLILRLGLPEDVPADAPALLRECAESSRRMLDPDFEPQPFLPEDL